MRTVLATCLLVIQALIPSTRSAAGPVLVQEALHWFHLYTLDSISLAAHFLLACQERCETDTLNVKAWVERHIEPADYRAVHRAYVIDALARLGFGLEDVVTFANGKRVTVLELLQFEVAQAVASEPINRRERNLGKEWGWFLSALCHYHPRLEGELRESATRKLQGILHSYMRDGYNSSMESGVHELHGIIDCVKTEGLWQGAEGLRAQVQQRLRSDLVEIARQAEKHRSLPFPIQEGWTGCDSKHCEAVRGLNQRAHLFELLHAFDCRHRNLPELGEQVLDDAHAVLARTRQAWVESHYRNRYHLAGALAHALEVAFLLAETGHRSWCKSAFP